MKQFTSCFIGIPLPKRFQEEFEELLTNIGDLYPNWEIVYPKTPHITAYYLDKQSQYVLRKIADIVQKNIILINNVSLTVEGFDSFTKQDPREGILFLNIIYPPALSDFNKELVKTLNSYYLADNNLPFHPHITIAKVNGLTNEQGLKENISQLEEEIGKVHWEFPVSEIIIYGVDFTKHPQHQKKLIHIPV